MASRLPRSTRPHHFVSGKKPSQRIRPRPDNFNSLLGAGSYYINILAVDPDFRSKGIGSRLVDLVRSRAIQEGFSKLSLHSFEDPRAVALYQRLGFTVAGRSPLVQHELLQFSGDLLLMMRSI
jgi:ribosomal protein S18 acetylase RimI-like enzyme